MNVTMPTNVQRPKIVDIWEIQSSTLPAMCYWLEMVGPKML